jgi:hypothetical protein
LFLVFAVDEVGALPVRDDDLETALGTPPDFPLVLPIGAPGLLEKLDELDGVQPSHVPSALFADRLHHIYNII